MINRFSNILEYQGEYHSNRGFWGQHIYTLSSIISYSSKKMFNKTWSSVSNSSLVRPWFQSKTNFHFKKIFGQEILGPKTNISAKKNFGSKKFWVQKFMVQKFWVHRGED